MKMAMKKYTDKTPPPDDRFKLTMIWYVISFKL